MLRFLIQAQRQLSKVKDLVSIACTESCVDVSMRVCMHIAHKYMFICILNGGAILQSLRSFY